MAQEDSQMAAEGEHCRREQERLELAARLASLAVTAEFQTRGRVILRRLPPTHPQHARCLRAATENVKIGFFSGACPYDAVRVLDIYKVGHLAGCLCQTFRYATLMSLAGAGQPATGPNHEQVDAEGQLLISNSLGPAERTTA